jgi:hypothetical protein
VKRGVFRPVAPLLSKEHGLDFAPCAEYEADSTTMVLVRPFDLCSGLLKPAASFSDSVQ